MRSEYLQNASYQLCPVTVKSCRQFNTMDPWGYDDFFLDKVQTTSLLVKIKRNLDTYKTVYTVYLRVLLVFVK